MILFHEMKHSIWKKLFYSYDFDFYAIRIDLGVATAFLGLISAIEMVVLGITTAILVTFADAA